jgi:hypothetical protein
MMHLLKIEWLKIRSYRAFIVLSSAFIIGVFAANYIAYAIVDNVVNTASTAGIMGKFSPYNFDLTWQSTSYATGMILLLPALLLIILVTNEFTYRTNRQNIIDGISREQFIDVKLLLAFIFTVVSTLLVIITAASFGFSTGTSFSLTGFSHVGFFFLKALSYNIIAVFISVLIKRTGFAIGVFFIYMGAENIISWLLDILSMKIKADSGTDVGTIGDYLPMNASDGLLTFPDNPGKSIMKANLPAEYTWVILGFAIVYLVLFFYLSRRNIQTKDL